MGFYIETAHQQNKVAQILQKYGSKGVSEQPYEVANVAVDMPEVGVVVVVDNGPFEAAGFAFNRREFDDFTINDRRPMRYLIMPRDLAEALSGF